MKTARNLICTCCGGNAGRWQQHWNRDTGYGLCPDCRDWIWADSNKDRQDFERTYGKPGVNYAPWPEPTTGANHDHDHHCTERTHD